MTAVPSTWFTASSNLMSSANCIFFCLPTVFFLLSKFIQGRGVSCETLSEVRGWEVYEGHLLRNLRALLLYQEWLCSLEHLSPTCMPKALTENSVNRLWESCAVFQFLVQAVTLDTARLDWGKNVYSEEPETVKY